MNNDVAGFYEHLRTSTVILLGYADADHLTAAQQIRVDRAIALRLVIDDAQARQMRGEAIDVRAFVSASEDLERMVGGNPEGPAAYDFSGAKEELDRLLADRAERLQYREQKESERLRGQVVQLTEEVAKLQAQLRAEPRQQQQPASTNVVPIVDAKRAEELSAQAAKERTAKERAQNERAWRDHYESRGVVMAPAWSHPDERRR